MTKKELIAAIAERTDLTQAQSEQGLNAFMDVVADTLKDGDKVFLTGFGTFEARERKARQGRNPRTGDTIDIAASINPAFKASKVFKDHIN